MATPINKLKNFYSFDTIAPSFIGSRYSNLKLLDILSFESAIKIRQDIITINTSINDNQSGLSSNLKAADLTYYKFLDTLGQNIVLAKEWIDADTVINITEQGGYKDITITLSGSVEDSLNISNALKAIGIINFDITIEDK